MAKARFHLKGGPQDSYNISKSQGDPLGIIERIGQDSCKYFPQPFYMKTSA